MLRAQQTTKDDKTKANFESKTFKLNPKRNPCLNFKQTMYCSKNCGAHGTGAMSLEVIISTGKRKGGSSISGWKRIDSTQPGEWLQSSVDIVKLLKEAKKKVVSFFIFIHHFFKRERNELFVAFKRIHG